MSTETLRPNGAGNTSYSYWTASAGTKWQCVDEVTEDSGDYVYTSTSYYDECFAHADTSASSGQTINSVTIHGMAKAASGTPAIRLTVRTHTGSSSGVSGDIALSASYAEKTYEMATNPITSSPWASSEIDSYDFGIQTRTISVEIDCDQFWIVVDYVGSGTLDQEGFRFRNDDGSESAATWKAAQDGNLNQDANTIARLRMLINATGDPTGKTFQIEYRRKPSGGAFGSYKKVV